MTITHPVLPISRLKQRRDFLRVAGKGRKSALPGLVLQAQKRDPGNHVNSDRAEDMRVGFTVTKKVGNAVVRNRVRRRLRAVAAEVMTRFAAPGRDYVLVGRAATLRRPYAKLTNDLKVALERLDACRHGETAT